jgi:hypothetical protein
LQTWLRSCAVGPGISASANSPSCNPWTVGSADACVAWVQGKTRRRRYQELRRLGVSEKAASDFVWSPKGPWRLSSAHALHRAYTNARFRELGLPSMAKLVAA